MTWSPFGNEVEIASTCPHCREAQNRVSADDGQSAPRPGDYDVCAACSGLAIFNDALELRELTAEEWAALVGAPEQLRLIQNVQNALREARKTLGRE